MSCFSQSECTLNLFYPAHYFFHTILIYWKLYVSFLMHSIMHNLYFSNFSKYSNYLSIFQYPTLFAHYNLGLPLYLYLTLTTEQYSVCYYCKLCTLGFFVKSLCISLVLFCLYKIFSPYIDPYRKSQAEIS